jgi:aspartyl-tRNA(Asn)/glutamyl-tRNA(Gln) amidotransferase subunit C
MPVIKKDVEYIASLAKLKFNESELDELTKDMNEILVYMEKLTEIDTSNIEPLTHPFDGENVFREDVNIPSISREEALKNAPVKDEEFFKVPKVIGQ